MSFKVKERKVKQGLSGGIGTSESEVDIGKWYRGQIWWRYSIFIYKNGIRRPSEIMLRREEGYIKENNDGVGESN
jgi:hypothetical protein